MKAGRELDALVAEKVMGLVFCDNVFSFERTPFYSTSISDAWQVVEKMKSNGLWFLLEYEEPPQCCYASFYAPINESGENGSRGNTYADTATLAICLAALKACGVEIESPK